MSDIIKKEDILLSTTELAKILKCNNNTITENAKSIFPNKVFINGKTTYYTEEEATMIIDKIQHNNNNQNNLSSSSIGIKTALTPALKIKQAMEMMQEAYEEELEILRLKNEEQQQLIEQQQPKVEFYDKVIDSKDWIDMGQVAKVLNERIGRTKLFEFLRNNKILDKKNNPYQQYQDKGYFRLIETSYNLPNGDCKIYLKTLVSQKGLDFIRKKLKK
ncbi:phage antirepressor KilAC domain-containing protein [uncultured Clostridium sp.]|uniref:phage antirepressor KilAC domain-containing protein n=1 Tax=uncultured Clostridium sp. TaxID=59620 RepID=UPI0025EFD5DE|nr:phage antirepressor KilAC domain-containing protein [uncultured Clostridium sp.]